MRHHQRIFGVCFFLLLLALAGNFLQQALYSPDVQFLVPGGGGAWLVHPNPLPGYPRAIFTKHFELEQAPSSLPVRIRAMRTAEVFVNDQKLTPTSPPGSNWKDPVAYDFGPALRQGPNDLRVIVTNPESPPALFVAGPDSVHTDLEWKTDQTADGGFIRHAVIPDRGEDFQRPIPNAISKSPDVTTWQAGLVAYLIFVVCALFPDRWKPWRRARKRARPATAPSARGRALAWILCAALAVIVGAIQLRNATVYPTTAGFDPTQHADYVRFVAERHEVPDASQGWEMSQPPLYYVLAAGVYEAFGGKDADAAAMRAVQMFTAVTTLAILLPAWLMLKLLFPVNPRMRVLGFVVAASLPMMFYMSPQVTNETLAALVISSAMLVAMRQSARGDVRIRDAVVVGALCGLSLLSKYTGMFVTLSVLGLSGFRMLAGGARNDRDLPGGAWKRRLANGAWTVAVAAVALGMSGWLYAHNVQKFGTPFMGAWDVRSGFRITQPPGYRTPAFFTRAGAVLWQVPSYSRTSSFADGMYGSMWADTHAVFLKGADEALTAMSIFSAAGGPLSVSLVLWLAILPTAAMGLGFVQAARHIVLREWDHPYTVLVVTSLLTVTSTLLFTTQHPWYSTLKAHWALSLVPAAGVFAALGLESMCRRLGPLRYLVYANLAALSALVLRLYWYRP